MSEIHIIFGSQGSGKSTYAKTLAEEVNGVHLAIDEWMGELYSPDLPQPIDVKWVMERVQRCEKRIWATARQITLCGGNVILDLGFMKAKDRERFINLAKLESIIPQLHYIDAPYPIRLKRVVDRNAKKGETFSFEVTPEMFAYMDKEFEKPTETELLTATLVYTGEK